MSKSHEEIKIEKNTIETDTLLQEKEQNESMHVNLSSNHLQDMQQKLDEQSNETLAERQLAVDSEKEEIEKKYSVPIESLEEIVDQERAEKIERIEKLYAESLELFKKGEKELAITKLQEGIEVDSTYYLAWLGLLQVYTDDFNNLQNFEELSDIYDKSILAMNERQRKSLLGQYGPQLQQKIDSYEQTYQILVKEDEQIRQEYQPKYNKAWQKSKPIFWILLAGMILFVTAMSISWPFLHFVAGDWIAYFAIIFTVFAGIFFLLFVAYAFRFAYLFHKKNFCARLGNSIYGEDMRKVAKECEKYKILLEDISISEE